MNNLFKKTLKLPKSCVDIGLGLVALAFSAFMLFYGIKKYASVSFGSVGIVTDRLFPYIIMTIVAILGVCITISGLFDLKHDKALKAAGKPVAESEFSIFIIFMTILGIFVVNALKPLGYPLTVSLAMLAIYYMLGGRKILHGLAVSVGFAVLSYLFFAVYLGVSLRLGFGL